MRRLGAATFAAYRFLRKAFQLVLSASLVVLTTLSTRDGSCATGGLGPGAADR
jgi:hypothetical protein